MLRLLRIGAAVGGGDHVAARLGVGEGNAAVLVGDAFGDAAGDEPSLPNIRIMTGVEELVLCRFGS
jgi:hypothetical protein